MIKNKPRKIEIEVQDTILVCDYCGCEKLLSNEKCTERSSSHPILWTKVLFKIGPREYFESVMCPDCTSDKRIICKLNQYKGEPSNGS